MAWNSSKESKQNTSSSSLVSSNSINSIVQGTELQGTIKATTDIRIDGKLTGNLDCKGKVIIGPTGFIDGDIQCTSAVIEGGFSGLLVVSELLHIKETAKVEGDVHTQKLIVQSGSSFNVSCKMGGQKVKRNGGGDVKGIELDKLSKVISG